MSYTDDNITIGNAGRGGDDSCRVAVDPQLRYPVASLGLVSYGLPFRVGVSIYYFNRLCAEFLHSTREEVTAADRRV